jgi:hypothetical protein
VGEFHAVTHVTNRVSEMFVIPYMEKPKDDTLRTILIAVAFGAAIVILAECAMR